MGVFIGPEPKKKGKRPVDLDGVNRTKRKKVRKTRSSAVEVPEPTQVKDVVKGKFFFPENTKLIKNSQVLDLTECGYLGDKDIRAEDGFLIDGEVYADIEMSLVLKGGAPFESELLILNNDKIVSLIPISGKAVHHFYVKQTLFFEKGYVNFRIKTKGEKIKILGIQTGYYSQLGITFS